MRRAVYRLDDEVVQADDCEPLRDAVKAGSIQLNAMVRGHYPGRRLPPKVLDGVCSIGYWDAESDQSWGLDWHCNEGLELTFLAAGRVGFTTEHFQGDLKSGSLTITRPWQPHCVGSPNVHASHLFWLILDVGVRRPHQTWQWPKWLGMTATDLRRLTRILRQNETAVWQANRSVQQIWSKIGKVLSRQSGHHQYSRLQIYISELLIELLSLLEAQAPRLEGFLSSSERSVELFLQRLAGDMDLAVRCQSVGQMASYCDLSEARFGQLCQQLVNQTPGRYLNQVRIQHAQNLLLSQPQASVTEIALASGFSSSQYFSTVFRQLVGESPRSWLAQALD